jgi:hypothetical protein
MMKTNSPKSKTKTASGLAGLKGVIRHTGKAVSIEEMDQAVRQRVVAKYSNEVLKTRALDRMSSVDSAKKIALDDL